MLFNSLDFLVFLAIVYAFYRVLPFRGQNWLLLVAGYVFYGWWDWRFLFLLIFSTTIDFWSGLVLDRGRLTRHQVIVPGLFLTGAALLLLGCNMSELLGRLRGDGTEAPLLTPMMQYVLIGIPVFLAGLTLAYRVLATLPEERRRKTCVGISVTLQLVVLGFFKYFNFFIDSLVASLNAAGFAAQASHFSIVLPVGISFYTFQSMSYAIDIYRRELKPTDRFFDFAVFVGFFPQLVAGPIERARNLLPQMSQPRQITGDQIRRGCFLIMFGMFKKVAIADGMAMVADQAYAVPDATWGTVVAGTLAFAVQIYCDFSGYSDIARGVAKLFGIELMYNFNQPYFAGSPRDFWQRWHISLSTWLSDYLYKPLGGNRGSLAFTCRNLMLTMLLGGLWHGAAWNYVLWGLYHGTALSVHRVIVNGRGPARDRPALAILKITGFGIITLYGWLLFRARSFDQVVNYTATLFSGRGGLEIDAGRPAISAVAGLLLLITWEIAQYRSGGDARFYRQIHPTIVGLAIAFMLFLTLMGTSNEPAQFIYFQF
ncbi:MBOAT family protein [Novosphingobium sp. Gsoil 351]|uniref:MBOAT family O-acyltransferase n=1 Tax=Novosphingobium sp. Gsoil 351 TaxID=2675225 RepID=UPI0012B473A7|nr:MBOAT family O-acyltransferase [Novosphingobium sp. Gsoil 351]QGN56109.1 MBOAT family protein [Novosphingobium sp. Gsoil 351]